MDTFDAPDIWKLMDDYNFVVDPDSLHDDMYCSICKKIMSDACHSVCGCQYCYKCISTFIGYNDKYCPGNKRKCKEEYLNIEKDVIRDTRMNNRIFKSQVLCPVESCGAKIELAQMHEHLRLCTKLTTECPFGAIGCDNTNELREGILIHLHKDALPHMELLMECIHNLRNEVSGIKSRYEISSIEINSLKEELNMKNIQMKEEIERQKRKLETQKSDLIDQFESLRKELNERIEDKSTEIWNIKREMMEEIIANKTEIESYKNEVKLKDIHIMEMKEEITKLKVEMENQKKNMILKVENIHNESNQNIAKVIEEIERHKIEFESQKWDTIDDIANLKKRLMEEVGNFEVQKGVIDEGMWEIKRKMAERKKDTDDQRREIRIWMYNWRLNRENVRTQFCNVEEDMVSKLERIKNERRRMNDLAASNKLCPFIDADFIWRIDGISKKRWANLFSDSFYSFDYKFCLCIRITSDDTNGDNIWLYYYIMKGDNDDNVQWPMRRPVTMSVINQETMEAYNSATIQYDTNKYDKNAFDRPRNKMNINGICTMDDIRYSSIKDNRSIIIDDSIIVSCVIGDE